MVLKKSYQKHLFSRLVREEYFKCLPEKYIYIFKKKKQHMTTLLMLWIHLAVYLKGVWLTKLKQIYVTFFQYLIFNTCLQHRQNTIRFGLVKQQICLNIDGKLNSQESCLRAHLMFLTSERTWVTNALYMTSHTCQHSHGTSDFKVARPGHLSVVVKCLW